jgi:hypothetical protein
MIEATITTTEVRDRDSRGALAVELAELLALLMPVLGNVNWRLLELEAIATEALDLNDLRAQIERDPTGLELGIDELKEVAAHLEQVVNAILVVPRHDVSPRRPPVDARFYWAARLVLECVDGDLWKVTTGEQGIHRLLQASFSDVATTA